jgi:hypothetical protein
VTSGLKLDIRLVRAMRRGAGELPGDLELLRGYLRTITLLLAEKAVELDTTWNDSCLAAAEIETLLDLEATVIERAIGVRAASLVDVQTKLAIWRGASIAAQEDDTNSLRTRLIYSVEADLARLTLGRPVTPQKAE